MPANGASSQDQKVTSARFLKQIEVNQTLTALYLIVEGSRWQCAKGRGAMTLQTIGES